MADEDGDDDEDVDEDPRTFRDRLEFIPEFDELDPPFEPISPLPRPTPNPRPGVTIADPADPIMPLEREVCPITAPPFMFTAT